MICRYVFKNGVRCKNDAMSESGYCVGHPPKGGGLTAPWVGAIAGAVSAVVTTINLAWPHVEPIIRTWIGGHANFLTRADTLLEEVLKANGSPDTNAELQPRIEALLDEADDLQNAVYGPGRVVFGHVEFPQPGLRVIGIIEKSKEEARQSLSKT